MLNPFLTIARYPGGALETFEDRHHFPIAALHPKDEDRRYAMQLFIVNLFAIATSAILALSYLFGAVPGEVAFLTAFTLAASYGGYQLTQRDGMFLGEALRDMFLRPASYPRRTAYWAYVGCTCVLAFIVAQSAALELI